MSSLSHADSAVLDRLFNPSGIDFGSAVPNPSAQIRVPYSDIDQSVLSQVRADETCAVQLAEQNQCNEALTLLNGILQRAPTYDSAYNNRAQVLQLLKRPTEAISDLTRAIELAESTGNVLVARQAYTQRGFLRQVCENNEDAARLDFEQGARLGSAIAKREAVKLNPYAQLCNQMVAQAMQAHQLQTQQQQSGTCAEPRQDGKENV